jgi:hypothetical protein
MTPNAPHTGKVFGLGLSKTGTSSLGDALNLLGYRTVHFPYDDATYRELRGGNYHLSILRTLDGIVDIPVAPYYAQLDAAWPGSKFVLTVRALDPWLRSAELHWQLMMDWWNNFPDFRRFMEFISAAVYGTVEFNRDRFAFVYETHLQNVRAYFHDRPQDLLVMDIIGGEGWAPLCEFLGVRVPNPVPPFPHANEWMHKLMQARSDIEAVVPEGAHYLLVDQEAFGRDIAPGRLKRPFTEVNGAYWGPPADDAAAIAELERQRLAGAEYLVIGWPSFWWREFYPQFWRTLINDAALLLETDRIVAFRLHV